MAVYKVPQDVEADDKLLGPFSFRQFIYLIVVAISGAGAWGLAQLFIPLAIIPLPFILFFGALALPLRKDQPMEAYLTAIVSFYFLKSRRRFWEPDGIDSFVTIIAPKNADIKRTKDINETEAEKRFSYLAGIVDSHGWAVRGQGVEAPANLSNDLYYEAQSATDVMDNNTSMAQGLDRMLQDSDSARKKQLMNQMQTPSPAPVPAVAASNILSPQPQPLPEPSSNPAASPMLDAAASNPLLENQPYQPEIPEQKPAAPVPNEKFMSSRERDAITLALGLAEEAEEEKIHPTNPEKKPEETPITTSVTPPSADTIDLATNRPDLTIQTISEEAHRLQEKEEEKKKADDEVFISLH